MDGQYHEKRTVYRMRQPLLYRSFSRRVCLFHRLIGAGLAGLEIDVRKIHGRLRGIGNPVIGYLIDEAAFEADVILSFHTASSCEMVGFKRNPDGGRGKEAQAGTGERAYSSPPVFRSYHTFCLKDCQELICLQGGKIVLC